MELEVRAGVEALVHRYGRLADTGKADGVASLFTDDGELVVAGTTHRAREGIVAFLSEMRDVFSGAGAVYRLVRHHLTSLDVEATSPMSATGRAYFIVTVVDGLDHWGSYCDDVVLEHGLWRFARRRVRIEGARPGSVAVPFVEI